MIEINTEPTKKHAGIVRGYCAPLGRMKSMIETGRIAKTQPRIMVMPWPTRHAAAQ
jgi:hypothetical protein